MKKILHKPIRDERGGVMVLALILLVVGGLIIAPLMGFMSTGLIVAQTDLEKMHELYAADAGIEYAIWRIKNPPIPATLNPTVNNANVVVNITRVISNPDPPPPHRIFRITSTATVIGGETTTTIEAHVAMTMRYVVPEGHPIHESDLHVTGRETIGNIYVTGNLNMTDRASSRPNSTIIVKGNLNMRDITRIRYSTIIVGGNLDMRNIARIRNSTIIVLGNLDVRGAARIRNSTIVVGGNLNMRGNAMNQKQPNLPWGYLHNGGRCSNHRKPPSPSP
ncbi:MAG: hypothetical protein AAGB97_09035 [Dehalococcoidia bacterium]